MVNLFIDDIRLPPDTNYVIVRSYSEAVGWMRQHGCPKFISFDHDLGEDHAGTGFDVAKWLVDRDLNDKGKFIPEEFSFAVHSANPVGKANIEGLLNNYLEYKRNDA